MCVKADKAVRVEWVGSVDGPWRRGAIEVFPFLPGSISGEIIEPGQYQWGDSRAGMDAPALRS